MNVQIRKLTKADIPKFTALTTLAYTGLGYSSDDEVRLADWASSTVETWPHQDLFGAFSEDKLVGSLCLHEFNMNIRGSVVKVGGVGSVAVGLLHKKQHVAKTLIQWAIEEFRSRGIPLVTLYPFEVGFYQNMGFGYGCELRQFAVKPVGFRDGQLDMLGELKLLEGTDIHRRQVYECYLNFYQSRHGMTDLFDPSMGNAFHPVNRVFGYYRNGSMEGYMVASFEKKHPFVNDFRIKELVYATPFALHAFSDFLYRQSDQFDRILLRTQDEALLHWLRHPGTGQFDAFDSINIETSVTGVGLMYRIVNVPSFLTRVAAFGASNCAMPSWTLVVEDDFLPQNAGTWVVQSQNGKIVLTSSEEIVGPTLRMPIRVFSSLAMGAVSLRSLLQMGLAQLSDMSIASAISAWFDVDQKPMCTLRF